MQRVWVVIVVAACGARQAPPATPGSAPAPVDEPVPAAAPDADASGTPSAATPATEPGRPMFKVLHALPGIDVVDSVNHAMHMHGGAAASIHHASINVLVKDARAHTIRVAKLELLHGHCSETTWDSRKALTATGYEVHDWDGTEPIATGTTNVTLPAKRDLYSVGIQFDGVPAYQACDRFGFAVQLVVDGTQVAVEVPLLIKRYEPIRRP